MNADESTGYLRLDTLNTYSVILGTLRLSSMFWIFQYLPPFKSATFSRSSSSNTLSTLSG